MPLGIQQDATLETLLSTFAHTIPVRVLSLLAGAGVLLLMVVWVWHPAGTWPLTAIGMCTIAFSLWAISNQQLETMTTVSGTRTSRATVMSLRFVRQLAAIVGVLSGAVLVTSLPMLLLGNWIS